MTHELNEIWEFRDGRVHAVGDARDIEDLLRTKLVEVRKGNWAILYRHKETGEFWDLTFPQGEMQGGGPRRLRVVSDPSNWVPYPDPPPARRLDSKGTRRQIQKGPAGMERGQ
jgi:hypothetical protein